MNYMNVVLLAISVKQGMEKDSFFESPYGTPEHRKALGGRPEGVAHRDVRDWPSRHGGRVGQRREPKPRSAG